MTADVERYLAVSTVLFVLGALGFFTRRNMIVMMLSAEMMLHGVSLSLVAFSQAHANLDGQAFTIFILTVAACEAGLALSLILALYRKSNSLDIELWTDLRESDLPPPRPVDEGAERPIVLPAPPTFPRLTPAGRVPHVRDRPDNLLVDDAESPTGETPAGPPKPDDFVKSVK
jgi:NADH-quinone oxidoreductase subunit K